MSLKVRVPVVFATLLLLVACGGAERGTTETPSISEAPSAISTMMVESSPTAMPQRTASPLPTATPDTTPTIASTFVRITVATPRPSPTPEPTATPTPTPLPTPTATVVPTPTPLPTVSDSLTPVPTDKVDAVLAAGATKDYQPVDKRTVFTSDDKWVYIVYQVSNLPADSTLEVVWVATDVPGLPHNFEFQRSHSQLSGDQQGVFGLGTPPTGLPTGSYAADLYLNGTLTGIYPFKVQ